MANFDQAAPGRRYASLTIALHWAMLVLLLAVVATMEFRGHFPRGSAPREAMKQWHYLLGLAVFGLVWLRLLARLVWRAPAIVPPPPAWQRLLAGTTHLALYALMVAMPLLGWLILSAEGEPVRFLGLDLPALIGRDEALVDWAEEVHEAGAKLAYALVALHAAAALMHHYWMRDDTLKRILPGRA